MLTASDIALLQRALDIATNNSTDFSEPVVDALQAKLAAMLPPPAAPTLRCTRCGRQQGDPQNDTCDMAPCPFA